MVDEAHLATKSDDEASLRRGMTTARHDDDYLSSPLPCNPAINPFSHVAAVNPFPHVTAVVDPSLLRRIVVLAVVVY
jgi:hypothetical protein